MRILLSITTTINIQYIVVIYEKNVRFNSDDPVPISEPRQRLIAPCLGLGAHEAIAGYTEFSLQRCQ